MFQLQVRVKVQEGSVYNSDGIKNKISETFLELVCLGNIQECT